MTHEELSRCAVEMKVGAAPAVFFYFFLLIPIQFGVKTLALLSFGNL
jgi:hypothetical protein